MDSRRAHEIVSSLGVIDVLYQGQPVWIENLKGNEAAVEFLDSSRKGRVPIEDLMECL